MYLGGMLYHSIRFPHIDFVKSPLLDKNKIAKKANKLSVFVVHKYIYITYKKISNIKINNII